MPVPWEALLPFGMVTFFFGVSGTLLNISTRAQNQGKPIRYNIDNWDEMMMRRDEQLTGHRRGQQDDPTPPPGYDTSSVWLTQQTR
ncbi:small secreted protein [Moniliophthora roreri MCA 2997]|uniref:NADH dehydrogenase [ubiquinone] 1 alpha subcomplex subunit 1 n=2 Tax=Moniliophthora roreri TaxID=221103 RepID=V2YDF4_MONRO|nr:small secreted protein [Moniliophthora roreri MCA 2997]KAI3620828.1 small secreted protein [Moniliophthora roreri]